ncbi:MAG: hypothetical protein DRJ10_06795 [Bacteroidetes bacterium]|nr:MAG: hypothetical protein DRJ10_06795 [Bacteroidota bacterium]
MDINTTFWYFDKLRNDKLCLLYNGTFSDDVTEKLISLSEYNISSNAELSKMKNKVSFLMAECFQNIVRHGETKTMDENTFENPGYFSTKNIDKTYFITSGNIIDKRNIQTLEEQLKQVNDLHKDQLKELFRHVISTTQFSDKGGAGLGLIEMARKSGRKIEFSFNEYDKDFSFFYSQISLEPKNKELNSVEEVKFPLIESIDFHKKMNEQNILLVQKGDFSQASILPVLKIIEQNLLSNKAAKQNKAVYHVLVELLQNVGKHGLIVNNQRDGIFIIAQIDSTYTITAGNYVERTKVTGLEKKLKVVQKATYDELEEMYVDVLMNGEESEDGGAGLGLIDIGKESKTPISYNFQEIDLEKVFLTINVSV